jgi:molecular chaperone GrpE
MSGDKEENQESSDEKKEEQESTPKSLLKEHKKDFEIEDKSPSLQLEFFSKNDLVDQVEELNKTVAEQTPKLKALEDEKEKLKNRIMLLQAEFENAQKRWDKSRQNLRIQHIASVLKNFLPLYDSFKKAIDSQTEENRKELETIKKFFNQFLNVFKSYKAEPIEVKSNDPFDYSVHEALTSIERDDIPENNIIEIIQEGWKIGKEVLRYAKVVISKKPKPPEPEPEPETEEKKEEAGETNENNEEEEITEEKEIK